MTETTSTRLLDPRRRDLWWLRPWWAAMFTGLTAPVTAYLVSDAAYYARWKEEKFFSGLDLIFSLILLLSVAGGSWLAAGKRATDSQASPKTSLNGSATLLLKEWAPRLGVLSLVFYVSWAVIGFARGLRPGTVATLFSGAQPQAYATVKEFLAPVAGVTTVSQVGILSISTTVLLWRLGVRYRGDRLLVSLLLMCALIRTTVYAERLALIEVLVPPIVLLVGVGPAMSPSRLRRFALVPLIAPLVLALVFGAFEYNRSWENYYKSKVGGSYVVFVANRLLGYYGTSSNNSALLLRWEESNGRPALPYFSFEAVWQAPVAAPLHVYERLSGRDVPQEFEFILKTKANQEFNNEGGLLPAVFDMGLPLAMVYWFSIGLLLGRSYRSFRSGKVQGYIVFPVMFVGLLELGRFNYFVLGRSSPALLAAIMLAIAAGRRSTDVGESKARVDSA